MHIAFFDFVTHFGGAQRSTLELAGRLSEHATVSVIDPYGCCEPFHRAVLGQKLEHHVLCPEEKRTEIGGRDRRIRRVLALTASAPGLWRVCRRLRRLVGHLSPDIIWSNSPKSLAALTVALRGKGPPIIFYLRGWYRPETVSWVNRWLFRRRVSAFLALGSVIRDSAISLGVAPDRIRVVPNAVDIDQVLCEADKSLESPLPQAHRPIRLVLPATFLPAKGQVCAIRALGRLVQDGYDAVLYLAGHLAGDEHKGYLEEMRSTARALKVEGRVCEVGWRNDLPRVICESTMVILPSHSEGIPRCVMEAMALRRPVAATPVGATVDLIQPGRTGWLFEVEDDEGLAQAVVSASTGPQREQIVLQAYEHVRDNFSPARQVRGFMECVECVLGGFADNPPWYN